MKDSEKALLALAAVGGYLYWAKKTPAKTSKAGPNNWEKGLQYKGEAAIRSKYFVYKPVR